MNERIRELAVEASEYAETEYAKWVPNKDYEGIPNIRELYTEKFAELMVKEMCGMMEQAEDDCYHLFKASERPTEYIEWLNQWRTKFEKHFGVESDDRIQF